MKVIRFLKGVAPYNATEIAGFSDDQAAEYVGRGWAEWYSEDEIPENVGTDADAGSDADSDSEDETPDADADPDPSGWTVDMLRAHLEAHEVDPDELVGTGAGGNVVKADLVKAVEALPA